jgi:hypothetical protein
MISNQRLKPTFNEASQLSIAASKAANSENSDALNGDN